jgi:hypothetical protein
MTGTRDIEAAPAPIPMPTRLCPWFGVCVLSARGGAGATAQHPPQDDLALPITGIVIRKRDVVVLYC